jgi:DNA-binding CsgD family transcriptional regulator
VSSTGKFSDLIPGVYDAGIEPEHWPNVLVRIAELFGAIYGGLIMATPLGHVEMIGSLGWDHSYVRSYGEHYGRMDPVMPAVIRAPTGTILTDTMVMPKAALERTEFYQDWVRPQAHYHAVAANFVREGPNVGVVTLTRSQREDDFQQNDLDLLTALTPHLQRAMRTHIHLAGLRAERNNAMEALDQLAHGIMVLDQSCRIMLANRVAEEILAQADGIGAKRLELHTATVAQTNEVRRLVAQAAGADQRTPVGGALLVDRPSMKRPFQVLISPLRANIGWAGRAWHTPVALVLIIDPERAPWSLERHLKILFKLTPAEARVACEIATGEGLVSAAESLGILPSTARTHLHRVFEKTDTQRQAELVKVVERVAILRTDDL